MLLLCGGILLVSMSLSVSALGDSSSEKTQGISASASASSSAPALSAAPLKVDNCPICSRAITATKDMAKRDKTKVSVAWEKYCQLGQSLEIGEEKFCYDTANMRATLHRLLDLGAATDRICRQVRETNADFCRKGETKIRKEVAMDGHARKEGKNRGIIYE